LNGADCESQSQQLAGDGAPNQGMGRLLLQAHNCRGRDPGIGAEVGL
jgi:hypothetical protein